MDIERLSKKTQREMEKEKECVRVYIGGSRVIFQTNIFMHWHDRAMRVCGGIENS